MDFQEFGLWDAIFNLGEYNDVEKLRNFWISFKGIVPTLVGTQKWKPDKEELEKELRRLGLAKEDVRITKLEDEIVLDPENPIENVSWITICIAHLGKMTGVPPQKIFVS